MGQDIEDINNDGLADIVELDMDPPDNYRKKMMLSSSNYRIYQNADYFGYQYQYIRNSLQLNQGPRVNGNDSVGDPIFSEIGFYSGIAETDWSWTPMVAVLTMMGSGILSLQTDIQKMSAIMILWHSGRWQLGLLQKR